MNIKGEVLSSTPSPNRLKAQALFIREEGIKTTPETTRLDVRPLHSWLVWLLLAVFVALMVRHAWLSDDAYITFRTVDNFLHGYGLRWNVAERVQSYTHPLWLFILALGGAVSGELYWSSLVLSMVVAFAAVILLLRFLVRDKNTAVIVLAALCLSRAYMDYTTSGLENPLTHLLLVCFYVVFFSEEIKYRFIWLGMLMALGMVNRVDTALLYVPALLYALLRSKRWRSWLQGLLGGFPFLLWEVFSLVYYGFLFPNTAYAKLNPGLITQTELWSSGIGYVVNSLFADPLTLSLVLVALVFAMIFRQYRHLPIIAGALAYILYCTYVGGDFMSGRFMTAPFLVGLIVLAQLPWAEHPRLRYALAGWIALTGLLTPYCPLWFGGTRAMSDIPLRWYAGKGVTDERGNYYGNTGLLPALQTDGPWPNHDWALEGMRDAQTAPPVMVKGSVGMYGYFVGTDTYVIDLLGLGDPLMARLPPVDPSWHSGHWGRRLPQGYLETLQTGVNLIVDPALAKHYDALQSITRDPLFDAQRWQAIWRMNRGDYDGLLESYSYFKGEQFTPAFVVENPGNHPYVYAYVWNNQTGALILLDEASQQGTRYIFGWTITSEGATFTGKKVAELAPLGALSDDELINVGVIFAPDADLQSFEKYELRFWWRQEENDQLHIVLPPLQYHSPDGEGYWLETDHDPALQLSPR